MLGESFLLLKCLCKKRGCERLREGTHGSGCLSQGLAVPILQCQVLSWGALGIRSHPAARALVIAQTPVSRSLFRATAVSEDIPELSKGLPRGRT